MPDKKFLDDSENLFEYFLRAYYAQFTALLVLAWVQQQNLKSFQTTVSPLKQKRALGNPKINSLLHNFILI